MLAKPYRGLRVRSGRPHQYCCNTTHLWPCIPNWMKCPGRESTKRERWNQAVCITRGTTRRQECDPRHCRASPGRQAAHSITDQSCYNRQAGNTLLLNTKSNMRLLLTPTPACLCHGNEFSSPSERIHNETKHKMFDLPEENFSPCPLLQKNIVSSSNRRRNVNIGLTL